MNMEVLIDLGTYIGYSLQHTSCSPHAVSRFSPHEKIRYDDSTSGRKLTRIDKRKSTIPEKLGSDID